MVHTTSNGRSASTACCSDRCSSKTVMSHRFCTRDQSATCSATPA
ncbi:hypothetical protein O977_17120 [Mycobacterium avium subsp. paratuberculosis 10-5975]|nr:hypothetical protein O977_17120 [Mycobacterium avium subsp. paratuberculosis 10-5975]